MTAERARAASAIRATVERGDHRLPTAPQIARARIASMPADTREQCTARMLRYFAEVQRAKDELARGEWEPLAS